MWQTSTNCTNSYSKMRCPFRRVAKHNVRRWLIAQMKAFNTPMKNLTLICGKEQPLKIRPREIMDQSLVPSLSKLSLEH